MTKEYNYTYLGTNGIISTPVHIDGIPCIKKIYLIADAGKKLKKGKELVEAVTVDSEEEAAQWTEV